MKFVLRSVLIIFMLFVVVTAADANIASIRVGPTTQTITLAVGETRSGTYSVSNISDQPQHVTVNPRYWNVVAENKNVPMESWLKISPTEFDLGPRETREVLYELTVPEGVSGELATMISFTPKPKENQAVNVIFSVSLYLKIKGSERLEYNIKDFKIWKFSDRKALGTMVVLENTGNIHFKPTITVWVRTLSGEPLHKAILERGNPVYPNKSQGYDGAIYNFGLDPGIYKADIGIRYADITGVFHKNIYFLVGPGGKVIFTFFKRPKRRRQDIL